MGGQASTYTPSTTLIPPHTKSLTDAMMLGCVTVVSAGEEERSSDRSIGGASAGGGRGLGNNAAALAGCDEGRSECSGSIKK